MKLRVKVALCIMLAVFAAMSLAAVLESLGAIPASGGGEGYLLREYGGYIAVFRPPEAVSPAYVTEIRVRDLPLGDRTELASGVTASDGAAVARLLEDYGA